MVPNMKEFPYMCRQEDQAVKEKHDGRGGAQPNEDVIYPGPIRNQNPFIHGITFIVMKQVF
jgi:hypothetical protein